MPKMQLPLICWQDRLREHCKLARLPDPLYEESSDRRGGRTAWSSEAIIPRPDSPVPYRIKARYWYDGAWVNNAREDAAELALLTLTGRAPKNPVNYPPPYSRVGIMWPVYGQYTNPVVMNSDGVGVYAAPPPPKTGPNFINNNQGVYQQQNNGQGVYPQNGYQ